MNSRAGRHGLSRPRFVRRLMLLLLVGILGEPTETISAQTKQPNQRDFWKGFKKGWAESERRTEMSKIDPSNLSWNDRKTMALQLLEQFPFDSKGPSAKLKKRVAMLFDKPTPEDVHTFSSVRLESAVKSKIIEMLLSHPQSKIREASLDTLAMCLTAWSLNQPRLNASSFPSSIAKCLNDDDPLVQTSSAFALSWLELSRFKPELRKLTRHDHPYPRQAASIALLSLGDTTMARSVVKLLDSKDDYMRGRAVIALETISGESWDNDTIEEDVTDAKAWWSKHKRETRFKATR